MGSRRKQTDYYKRSTIGRTPDCAAKPRFDIQRKNHRFQWRERQYYWKGSTTFTEREYGPDTNVQLLGISTLRGVDGLEGEKIYILKWTVGT